MCEKICSGDFRLVQMRVSAQARTFYGAIRHDDIWREQKLFHAELDVHHMALFYRDQHRRLGHAGPVCGRCQLK